MKYLIPISVHQTGSDSVARKRQFIEPIQRDFPCPAPQEKIFLLLQISARNPAVSSLREGRIMIVTNVGMGCGGRGSVERETESQGGFPVSDRVHADERR